MVDANMSVYEREPMKTGRFQTPLALIRDRFILALGGYTGRTVATKTCECYDTVTNYWVNINSLPSQSVNTTAVVMHQRWVYLMPGNNREAQVANHLFINLLDTGSSQIYDGNSNSRDYGAPMARQKWTQLEVNNVEFVRSQPVAGIQLNNTDMLIFGGDTTKTFQFDTREVQAINKQASVRTARSNMTSRAKFGHTSDWVGRTFGSFIYCIDASEFTLHVYAMKDAAWNS